MSRLNTYFNYRTAQNTAATARGTQQLVTADRIRELRERGLITPSSTPADIAFVEDTLAAQMRARIELQEGRRWPLAGPTFLGALSLLLLVFGSFSAVQNPAETRPVLVVIGWLGLGVATWLVLTAHRRREAKRANVLSRAVVRDGRCGWCQQPSPHVLEGEPAEPRVFHALEVERGIGSKRGG